MADTSRVEAKLREMGLRLPTATPPIAEYVPGKRVGDIVYISGHGPIQNGRPTITGRVGSEVTLEQAYEAAQLCALNCLASLKLLIGSLDCLEEVVEVRGFVNSDDSFHEQPAVMNGASELLVQLYGERGKHARAALGTSNLPMNIPVEVLMIVRISRAA
jgi:enamine deaminase RidA (YjgF/YER057c/UK114 family)